MTSFGWDVLTVGLAAGLGLGLTRGDGASSAYDQAASPARARRVSNQTKEDRCGGDRRSR